MLIINSGYPVYILGRLIESMEYIFDNSIDVDINSYIVSLAQACQKRFSECRDSDLKEIDSMSARGFFGLFNTALFRAKKINNEDVQKYIEGQMLINFIKSDNLMRKLQGIAMLSENLKINEICKQF